MESKTQKKRVVIAVGGTGGHIYPAISLAKELSSYADVLFVGGDLKANPYFAEAPFSLREVYSGTLSLRHPVKGIKGLGRIYCGVRQSRAILKNFHPDLVVGFGSFHSLPALVAALSCRVPVVLHEQNCCPGRVNRLISPYAKMTATQFPLRKKTLKGTLKEVRPFSNDKTLTTAEEARKFYGLSPSRKTLLIFGGSQGAQVLNERVPQAMELLKDLDFQVIHFTGKENSAEPIRSKYHKVSVPCYVAEYERDMPKAWVASDLVISRAGAGTISELIAFEKPAILVPYRYAMDDHQTENAEFIAETLGGGVHLPEKILFPELLAYNIQTLMDTSHSQTIKEAIKRYKETNQTPTFSEVIQEILSI